MPMRIKKMVFFTLGLVSICGLLFAWNLPVGAAPQFQLTPFLTPTPGIDGRILYVVQPGDTLWRIAAVGEVSLDELRSLNNLDPDQVILEGQILLLGLGGPANAPTLLPGETPVIEFTPTPTEELEKDTVTICVLLYNDLNGDAIRQESEVAIPDGEVSVTERTGLASEAKSTNDIDPIFELTCFRELPEGNYTVSIAAPEGYNNTTVQSVTLDLADGDTSFLNFGAQVSALAGGGDPADIPLEEGGRSPLLGVLGIGVLLLGLGLMAYSAWASRRKQET